MSKAFGTEFLMLNNVYQPLENMVKTPTGKSYVHLATVARGLKQYMAYLDKDLNQVWIEEVDTSLGPRPVKHIHDDEEWNDVYHFMNEHKVFIVGVDEEIAVTEKGVTFA